MTTEDACERCRECLEKAEAVSELLEDENGNVNIDRALCVISMVAGSLIAVAGQGDGQKTMAELMIFIGDVTDAINEAVADDDVEKIEIALSSKSLN